MFGDEDPLPASFPYEFLGIVSPNELSWIYSEATAGLAFSTRVVGGKLDRPVDPVDRLPAEALELDRRQAAGHHVLWHQ